MHVHEEVYKSNNQMKTKAMFFHLFSEIIETNLIKIETIL